eukprot:4658695-Alexandrium_andersonii.AAC.1
MPNTLEDKIPRQPAGLRGVGGRVLDLDPRAGRGASPCIGLAPEVLCIFENAESHRVKRQRSGAL